MNKRSQDPAYDDGDALLAPFFDAARAQTTDAMPDALHDRLLRDALAQCPAPPSAPEPAPGIVASGLMARIVGGVTALGVRTARLLGGAPGVAVVCSAGVAGVWIGLSVPETHPLLEFATGATSLDDSGSVWAQTAQDIREDEALLAFLDSF